MSRLFDYDKVKLPWYCLIDIFYYEDHIRKDLEFELANLINRALA